MDYQLSNTTAVSKAFCMLDPSEKLEWSRGCAYIGKSGTYALPVFFGVETVLNRHACIIGMSGSGKTFLLKNLVSRLAYSGSDVMIIDWNGEYSSVVSYLYGAEYKIENDAQAEAAIKSIESGHVQAGVASMNISCMRSEEEKRTVARMIMRCISSSLGAAPVLGGAHRMLILDEAWKALGGAELSTLFREGRKYGLGLIIASQTVSDMASDILANCATVIMFRMQNREDFSTLSSAQILDGEMLNRLGGLARGSCIVAIAMDTDRPRRAVYVPRVEGIGYSLCYILGGGMEVTVPIEMVIGKLGMIINDPSKKRAIENYITQNRGRIEVSGLISELASNGVPRSSIVAYIRSLGVPDQSIIRAYEKVM